MKNIVKYFLAFLLAVSIVLMGFPESATVMKVKAESADNKFELADYSNLIHTSEVKGRRRTSFLGKRADGGYQAVVYDQGKIYIKNLSGNYRVEFSKEINLELPIWGGIFLGEDYNYVICGKGYDKQLEHNGEVYRIIKYSKNFERIGSISLNGEETHTALPFEGGNVSLDENGKLLTVYTGCLRDNGYQSYIAIHIDTSDMTVAGIEDGLANYPNSNYVSNSFRQIVKYDGKEPVYADMSNDDMRRSIFLQFKNTRKALLNIAGHNILNAELSGLEISDTNYLAVGTYVNQNSNNIFLSSVDKVSGKVENQWLTDSSAFARKAFRDPRIVKIMENKFVVMWGSDTTQYILVNGEGEVISELKECSAPVTDCEPIYDNGRVLFLSIEKGTMTIHEIRDFSSNGIYKPETGAMSSELFWDGTVDISWYADNKTEFNISTAEQLAGLAQLVNSGNTFEGKKIDLCQDIFLNDESYQHIWIPIATRAMGDDEDTNVFQGTFCGNRHTIYNMKTDNSNAGGLFGRIGKNGSVKCVDISQGFLNYGGCIANINEGMISFCNNYSSTKGENIYAAGGICNINVNSVYGCKNFGEVWGNYAAGIVGLNKEGATVSQCSNHALAGGWRETAGIVCYNYGWLYNCYNRGIVADRYWGNLNCSSCFWGIVYRNDGYGVVNNCYSAGVFSYPEGDYWPRVYGNGICMEDHGREITNCYVLSASGQSNIKKGRVSYEEMADPAFIQEIDQQTYAVLPAWKEDVNKINGGLPITAADESSYTGQCKIQPEVWIYNGKKVIEANLEDKKYDLYLYCYYNDSAPIVTIEDTDIAEISGDSVIWFKKAGTTYINIHIPETENNSSADYRLTLKIKGNTSYMPKTIKLSKTKFIYNNKNQKPTVIIKDSKGKALSSKTDYTVSYPKSMKNVGKYTVTIKFKGNYSGTVKKIFTIVPKGTSISKVTPKKKGFTVKWKKQTVQTTGYEIAYSTDKKFSKKNTKVVAVGKNKTTSKSVSKLKAKKKYYVRIRTYKTVKGKKYYSVWSKVKTVTTKK